MAKKAKKSKKVGSARKATATRAVKAPSRSTNSDQKKSTGARPGRNAELVIRQGFVIDATGKEGPRAVPEVIILGNEGGFRYMAELFDALAKVAGARSKEPHEGLQLHRGEGPFDHRFSDDFELRFVPMNAVNRAATMRKLGITQVSRQSGSLFERYQEVAAQFSRLTQLMKREDRREAHSQQ